MPNLRQPAQRLHGNDRAVWIVLALISFAVLAIVSAMVLWPREFRFRSDVRHLLIEIDSLQGGYPSAGQLRNAQRDWAYWAWKNYEANQPKIDCLTGLYTGGLAALTLELLLLTVGLLRL